MDIWYIIEYDLVSSIHNFFQQSSKHLQAFDLEGQRLDGRHVQNQQDTRNTARKQAIKTCVTIVHWLATEEVANMKYKSLINLLQWLDLPTAKYLNQSQSVNYQSDEIFQDCLLALDQTQVDALKEGLLR